MTAIMARAEMTGAHILTAAELASCNVPYLTDSDVAWQHEGVTGTLRLFPASYTATTDALAKALFDGDARSCEGRFSLGMTPDERSIQVVRGFEACERTNGISDARYIIVPRPDGSRYLFSVFGTLSLAPSPINLVKASEIGLRQEIYSTMRQ